MRIRLIPFVVVLLIATFHVPQGGFSTLSDQRPASLSLVQVAALGYMNLERNLQKVHDDCEKEEIIAKTTQQIERLKIQYPAQFKGDEKQLALFLKKIEFQRAQLLDCKI